MVMDGYVDLVTFGGRTSDDPDFGIELVTVIQRPLLTDTKDKTISVTGMDGVWDLGADRGPANILVIFYFQGGTMEQLRAYTRNLAAWLSPKTVKPLIFADEPDKQYFARRTSEIPVEQVLTLGHVEVNFFCPDPHAHAITTKTASPNAGTAPTPVKITATMTANTDHLQVDLGDQHIRLETALTTGDEILIDTNQGWVALNGLDARDKLTYDSELRQFLLPVGEFTLSADNATLSYVYRERWL